MMSPILFDDLFLVWDQEPPVPFQKPAFYLSISLSLRVISFLNPPLSILKLRETKDMQIDESRGASSISKRLNQLLDSSYTLE